MNIVIFLQALFVSISLQYLTIESADTSLLWNQYYLIFNTQLAEVFRSSASLLQAQKFAQKHSYRHSALRYGCSSYKSGQIIGCKQSIYAILYDNT